MYKATVIFPFNWETRFKGKTFKKGTTITNLTKEDVDYLIFKKVIDEKSVEEIVEEAVEVAKVEKTEKTVEKAVKKKTKKK